jgi:hypothetical protein
MWIGPGQRGPGLLLLAAYPTKALTNPLFYVKLTLIAVAFVTAHRIRHRLSNPRVTHPRGSGCSPRCHYFALAAIPAGRLLATPYSASPRAR